DEIEPTGRTSYARRREVVVNGRWVGSVATHNALRVVLDRDDISARNRCVKRYGHRAGIGVLGDRRGHSSTVGVKHILRAREVEFAGEGVHTCDRLSDRYDVVAGWHRHRHPVEEHTGGDVVLNLPAGDAVIQVGQ